MHFRQPAPEKSDNPETLAFSGWITKRFGSGRRERTSDLNFTGRNTLLKSKKYTFFD